MVAVVARLLILPIPQEVLVVQVEEVVQDLVMVEQGQVEQETHHQHLRHKDQSAAQV